MPGMVPMDPMNGSGDTSCVGTHLETSGSQDDGPDTRSPHDSHSMLMAYLYHAIHVVRDVHTTT